MRHGLVAFGITTAVLVPAALQRLTAGSAQVAKLAAPGARTVTLGGATIDVALDRAIVDAGGQVHVALTSRAPVTRKVTLAVVLMEQSGSGGSRVDTPPLRIARELVTFTPGGPAARTLALTLRGRRDQEMEGIAAFGHYTILVMAPEAADRLEKLRRRVGSTGQGYETWAAPYDSIGRATESDATDDDDVYGERSIAAVIGKPGATARLEALTRAADSPVSLRVPDSAPRGQPFTVVVTVKNRGKQAIHQLGVRLGTPPLYAVEAKGLADEQLAIEPALATIDLGPRQSQQVSFRVTASAVGTAGLYASTSCDQSDSYEACDAILDGQLDATDIVAPAEAAPAPAPTVATAPAEAAPAATTVALAAAAH